MRRFGLIAAVALTFVSGAGLMAASAAGPASQDVVDVRLTIRHSRFVPAVITVPVGTAVRFVVDNTDPIAHELIVGDQAVQNSHEKGTDAVHGEVPGEVSIPPGEVASTTYEFTEPGDLLMGCHLPGHWTYGMSGTITVT